MNNGLFPGLTQRPGKIRPYPRFNASKWPAKAAWLGNLGVDTSLRTATITSDIYTGIAFANNGQRGVTITLTGATQFTNNGGLTWSAGGALPTGTSWTSVVYSTVSNLFVAINSDATNPGCATSPDGVTWTQRATLTAGAWIKPAINGDNGLLLTASTASSTAGFSSADGGITWTSRTLNAMGSGAVIATWGNGLFAVAGTSGTSNLSIQTSPDAITWTNRFTGNPGAPTGQAFAYGTAGFTALFGTSTLYQISSVDGLTWQIRHMTLPITSANGAGARGNRMQYANSLYQYFGNEGLYVSSDASVWRGPYGGSAIPASIPSDIFVTAEKTFTLVGGNTAVTIVPYTDPLAQDMLYVP